LQFRIDRQGEGLPKSGAAIEEMKEIKMNKINYI
jgi:hypothetical protein